MPLALDSIAKEHLAKLAPYARSVFDRTADYALRLFADEVAPEHLLSTMMADDDCGAHHAVIYAFADPQTIDREALALSPGILVVSSSHSMPFSPRGVDALFAARKLAIENGLEQVSPAVLLLAAFQQLEPSLMSKLVESKFSPDDLAAFIGSSTQEAAANISETGALFACFSEAARRILGLSCKIAKQNQRSAISPAHLLGACAQREGDLADHGGLSAMQLSSLIGRQDADQSELEPRSIPLDPKLLEFLANLPRQPGGLSTLALLDGFCRHGTDEVQGILVRSRITSELLQKIAKTYTDPPTAG